LDSYTVFYVTNNKEGDRIMPKGKRREICLKTGKKPTHKRQRKNQR